MKATWRWLLLTGLVCGLCAAGAQTAPGGGRGGGGGGGRRGAGARRPPPPPPPPGPPPPPPPPPGPRRERCVVGHRSPVGHCGVAGACMTGRTSMYSPIGLPPGPGAAEACAAIS